MALASANPKEREPWIGELTPDTWLDRPRLAQVLTAHGFPIMAKTLQRKAAIRQGPPYRIFGRKVAYQWGSALAWAEGEAKSIDPSRGFATKGASQ